MEIKSIIGLIMLVIAIILTISFTPTLTWKMMLASLGYLVGGLGIGFLTDSKN